MGFLENVNSAQPQTFGSAQDAVRWLQRQGAVQQRDGSYRLSSGLTATIQPYGRGVMVSFNGCAC